ncbi:hypothetical protein [Microbulbifer agarilyticus]|uniref:hypothetical protein n=1 Tax=Microbulbifer agarilyticus TaxID=260552 RepID=UPI0012FBF6D8|nr:hypothetical protein [Microbulbifer agarilyticus]
MKCPSCSYKIGLLSKEANSMAKSKSCPKCGAKFSIGFNWKLVAIYFFPFLVLNIFANTAANANSLFDLALNFILFLGFVMLVVEAKPQEKDA